MTSNLQTPWQISDQAIANAVGDEMVVLHLANGTYFGLDPVGAILWDTLSAGHRPAAALERILANFDVTREVAEQDLDRFLGELEQGGLIARA